ncbi:MAG: hypothetical protein IPK26_31920 [Planctomycetes bacterium]|nr:hypothetical protein [Planctomycetota bacterium]
MTLLALPPPRSPTRPASAISNTAPGTGSFLSGLHPDATNPPFNPGRADDVSLVYLDTQMPNGRPVFFLADSPGNFWRRTAVRRLLAPVRSAHCV